MTIPLPENYSPSEKEEYMNDTQLEYFRRKLEAWKKEILDESSETLSFLKQEDFNESDVTDRASLETDAALDFRKKDRYRKLIAKIDSALDRIDRKKYGFCKETGNPIGIKRLEARPIATYGTDAQEEHEEHEEERGT